MVEILPILSLIVWGLLIGLIAGLAGVGGGALVTPLFKLAYGLPIVSATSTSLFTILPTSLSGAIKHVKNGYTNVKIGLLIGIVGAVFSVPGSLLAPVLPPVALTVITGLCMVIPAATLVWSIIMQKRSKSQEGIPNNSWHATKLSKPQILICSVTGVVCGVLSGLVGIGGGAGLLTPVMLICLRMEMHEMAGTSSIIICFSSVPAVIAHAFMGNINWLFGILIACGTIPGAHLGATIAPKFSSLALKYVFCGVLLLCSVAMIFNAVM